MTSALRALSVTVALAVALAACGSEPRALDADEASALSQVLVRDLESGGASFVADVPYGPGTRLELVGDVDWVNHQGLGVLTTFRDGDGDGTGELDDEVTDIAWTDEAVAVRAQDGNWTWRAADPSGVPLDQVIALIVGVAGDQRDNPLLVAQSEATWLRNDDVDGVAVDVIDSGGRLVYWIGADGLLHRLDADIEGFDGSTTITFGDHGERQIDLPR